MTSCPPLDQAYGLYPPHFDLFTEIVTNPAHFEPDGLLKLSRRVSPDGPQHGCKVGCSANMCKGEHGDGNGSIPDWPR